MTGKELGQQPAQAQHGLYHPDHGVVTVGSYIGECAGMTKRETFAKDAPPCPDWFKWPKHNEMRHNDARPALTGLPPEEVKEVETWLADPCYDLPEGPMRKYQEAIENWRSGFEGMILADRMAKITAWATLWADAMLEQLAKEA